MALPPPDQMGPLSAHLGALVDYHPEALAVFAVCSEVCQCRQAFSTCPGLVPEGSGKLHQFAASDSEEALPCEFAEVVDDLAKMSGRIRQPKRVLIWHIRHMYGMSEGDYPVVKARFKC